MRHHPTNRIITTFLTLALALCLRPEIAAVDLAGQGIGDANPAGTTTLNAGVYTVIASGGDIWGTADSCHFGSTPMTGNSMITAHGTGLVVTDGWAKAGVMMRDGTAAGAKHLMMAMTGGNDFHRQWRPVTDGESSDTGNWMGKPLTDYWVRLVRIGNRCWALAGNDVANNEWALVGDPIDLAMTDPRMGLAVTSHVNGTTTTATYDQVTFGTMATRNPYVRLEVEAADMIIGARTETAQNDDGGLNVGWLDNGDHLVWGNVDFGAGAGVFTARVSSGNADTTLTVRLDAIDGPLLGTLTLPNTGGWQTWQSAAMTVDPAVAKGVHPLFVVSSGGHNLNWFQFTTAPQVTSITATNGRYRTGDTIPITVTFDRNVEISEAGGAATLALSSGGTATYDAPATAALANATKVAFLYTVGAGDAEGRLDAASATALTIPVGSHIRSQADQGPAIRTVPVGQATGGALANTSNAVIDLTGTHVTGVTGVQANGTHGIGTQLTIVVTFDGATTVAGSPVLALNTSPARSATYDIAATAALADATKVAFLYTVQAGDASIDLDYAATGSLTGGTLTDDIGNAAIRTLAAPGAVGSLGNDRNWRIDGVRPTVASLTGNRPTGTYGRGTAFTITAGFSKVVTVAGGIPTLTLNSGGTATYASGSGSANLVFTYTAAAGESANPLAATAWNANGATIADAVGNTVTLSTPALTPAYDLRDLDITPARITGLSATGGAYRQGQAVTITMTWDQAVTVTTAGGAPTLALNAGGSAVYQSGSGSAVLTFLYTVGANANTDRLDAASVNALGVPGGSAIVNTLDAATADTLVPVGVTAGALAQTSAVVIDTVAPAIATITASTGIYHAGDTIAVTMNLTGGPVLLTTSNLPSATMTIGGGTAKTMTRTTGIGSTTTLVFTYGPLTVADGAGTVTIAALTLPAGQTITDAAGNALSTILPASRSPAGVLASQVTITLADQTYTYDGTPKPARYLVTPADIACQVTYTDTRPMPPTITTDAPVEVGTYTVKVTVTQTGYSAASSAWLTIVAPAGSSDGSDSGGGSCGSGSGLGLAMAMALMAMLRSFLAVRDSTTRNR